MTIEILAHRGESILGLTPTFLIEPSGNESPLQPQIGSLAMSLKTHWVLITGHLPKDKPSVSFSIVPPVVQSMPVGRVCKMTRIRRGGERLRDRCMLQAR